MRMAADAHIYPLLHQEGRPLFFILVWRRFLVCTPVGYKDYTVADLLCLFDIGGHLFFVERIDHVCILICGQATVGAVGIVQKGDGDIVDGDSLDRIPVFLGCVCPDDGQSHLDKWRSNSPVHS